MGTTDTLTAEREAKIRELAKEAEIARMAYEASQMANVPVKFDDQIKAAADNAVIAAKMAAAKAALEREINGYTNAKTPPAQGAGGAGMTGE